MPGRPKPLQWQGWLVGCAFSSNAELQPAGMHRRPQLLMAANVIFGALAGNLVKVNNLLAISLLLSIVLPGVVEARPVDGETGGEINTMI